MKREKILSVYFYKIKPKVDKDLYKTHQDKLGVK